MDEVEFTNDADVQEHFGGIEPVNVGDLSDVQEQKLLIPATKNVKLLIKDADMRTPKDHNDYRWINLQLQLVDGIDEAGKYKGKVVFGMVAYYANPAVYTKDFFTSKQHLVNLKQLIAATGIDGSIDGHTPEKLKGKVVLADIWQKKDLTDNEVGRYKTLSIEGQV